MDIEKNMLHLKLNPGNLALIKVFGTTIHSLGNQAVGLRVHYIYNINLAVGLT